MLQKKKNNQYKSSRIWLKAIRSRLMFTITGKVGNKKLLIL